MPSGCRCLRTSRLGFLVPGLAMNDAGNTITRILLDAFPNTHHIATRGVHHHAPPFLNGRSGMNFRPKCRDDHNVLFVELGKFGFSWPAGECFDAHSINLLIHLGVVDDFT